MQLYGNRLMASNHTSRLWPVLALLSGAALWGVIWYPMRRLEAAGLTGVWLTLILYGSALVFSLPRTARTWRELRRSPALLMLLMLSGGWTNIAFVEAVLHGNILRVLLLFYLSPLWATIMGWFVLGERVSMRAGANLALAMGGALLMLWDPRAGAAWPRGAADWFAISSGFAFAFGNVLVRKAEEVSIAAKAASVWIGVALVATVMILLLHLPPPQAGMSVFAGAVALGLFGILLMTLLVQYGVTHMPVHQSAVIMLFELVAGAISQQLLTTEHVGARDWAGGMLIVAGAYLSARASRH